MIFQQITSHFRSFNNPKQASKMSAYMRNQFSFIGIPSPERKAHSIYLFKALKSISKSELLDLSKQLWLCDEREFQYFTMELLDKHKLKLTDTDLKFGEFLILNKSWWDTVDYLATHFFAPILLSMEYDMRKDYVLKLANHNNMWLNRVGIIFQLSRKMETETELLELAILPHLESKEFFHQKAIGWALRQYAKYNPGWLIQYLQDHKLSSLSVREAMKSIN